MLQRLFRDIEHNPLALHIAMGQQFIPVFDFGLHTKSPYERQLP
jgi:hypothetical protein